MANTQKTRKKTKPGRKCTKAGERFRKNFVPLLESGMSVSKIAKRFGLNISYAYKIAKKICEEKGLSPDYYHVKKSDDSSSSDSETNDLNDLCPQYGDDKYKPILDEFDRCSNALNTLKHEIEKILKNDENNSPIAEKEREI